jgi:NAD-dependent SIR2 family protein deacetylase
MSILEIHAQNASQLQALADIVADSRKVIVMTGAGISTNSGIPVSLGLDQVLSCLLISHQDFRSEGGLYSLIQEQFDAKAREQGESNQELHSDEGYFDMSLGSLMSSSLSPETSACEQSAHTKQGFNTEIQQDDQTAQDPKSSESNPELDDGGSQEDYGSLSSSQVSQITDDNRRTLSAKMKGKDLFDARIWADPLSTSVFYTFIAALRKKIREEVSGTTTTHKFIRTLRDGGRLVRCYTQNIDGLEAREGLSTSLEDGKGNRARLTRKVLAKTRPTSRPALKSEMDGGCEVVQLHGDLEALRCGLCQDICGWDDGRTDFEQTYLDGRAPVCQGCIKMVESRQSRGRRATAIGTLRPNIVLYGEGHPSEDLISELTEHDLGLGPDLLLIIGTSLRVHGLKVLIREFAKSVHCRGGERGKVIFVNNTKPAKSIWGDVIDYWINMDCDAWIEDLKTRREDLWQRQGEAKLPARKRPRKSSSQSNSRKEFAEVVSAAKILVEMSSSPPRPTGPSNNQAGIRRGQDNGSVKYKARVEPCRNAASLDMAACRWEYSDTYEPHVLPPSPMTPTTQSVLNQLQAEYRNRPLPTPPGSARSCLTSIFSASPGNHKRKYETGQPNVLQDICINVQSPSRSGKPTLNSRAAHYDQASYESVPIRGNYAGILHCPHKENKIDSTSMRSTVTEFGMASITNTTEYQYKDMIGKGGDF